MSVNITGLLIILLNFVGFLVLIGLLYLIYVCYKKIKHRANPIGEIEPLFNIGY